MASPAPATLNVQASGAPSPPPVAATPAASDLARQALENGTTLENAGDLPGALQQFERWRQIDPSATAAADQSINRVRARMRREGTDAFTQARQYDALDRIEQAIPLYERAFRYLPDEDPKKQDAKNRLDALRRDRQ